MPGLSRGCSLVCEARKTGERMGYEGETVLEGKSSQKVSNPRKGISTSVL